MFLVSFSFRRHFFSWLRQPLWISYASSLRISWEQDIQEANLSYLWQAAIGTLSIDTTEMKWTENILPNIGYDRYRLVEVGLPSSNTLVPEQAIEYFKQAKKVSDEGNNQECLRVCRLALEEIKKHLQIQNFELGTAVTKKLGWRDQPELTEQAKFLNHTWRGLYILANAANHTPSNLSLLPADAHTGLLSVATMLEYLGQLEKRTCLHLNTKCWTTEALLPSIVRDSIPVN
jgi:hypothetical protein